MEDLKAEERHEPLVHEVENEVEGTVEPIGKDAAEAPTVDEPNSEQKSSVQPAVENLAADQAENPSVDEINEPAKENQAEDLSVNAAKEPTKDNVKNTDSQTEVPIKNSVSPPSEPSKRVQEGQKWNDRDREKHDHTKNIKSDLTSQEESNDPVAIRKQVEFYFSESNLLVDKFLFSKVEGHANLPVPLSVILSFKRMRHFQPLTAVVQAIKESTVLNLVDNDSCVQRKVPLPRGLKDRPMHEIEQVYEDQAMGRSIYVKGFGDEKPGTQFDIEAFFADYGPTNSVRLRRANDKTFKGSVFVEFDSEATQKTFLSLDPKPKWKGADLDIKSKKQYCDEKVEDIRKGLIQPNTAWKPRGNKQNSPGDRQGGDNNDRDWRARRDDDRKSGLGDRNGGRHRGFGSSGRSGRGGRRGRGGRVGRHNDRSNHQRKERDEHQVPKVGLSDPDPAESHKPTSQQPAISQTIGENGPTTINDPAQSATNPEKESKKRSREADDDGGEHTQGSAKKIDLKAEAGS